MNHFSFRGLLVKLREIFDDRHCNTQMDELEWWMRSLLASSSSKCLHHFNFRFPLILDQKTYGISYLNSSNNNSWHLSSIKSMTQTITNLHAILISHKFIIAILVLSVLYVLGMPGSQRFQRLSGNYASKSDTYFR